MCAQSFPPSPCIDLSPLSDAKLELIATCFEPNTKARMYGWRDYVEMLEAVRAEQARRFKPVQATVKAIVDYLQREGEHPASYIVRRKFGGENL